MSPASFLIRKNNISSFARIIPRQVNSLGWKIDRLERLDRFRRRQTFLAAGGCSFQRSFNRTVDPDFKIEMTAATGLEQENSFEQNNVDLAKIVAGGGDPGRIEVRLNDSAHRRALEIEQNETTRVEESVTDDHQPKVAP